MSSLLCLNEYQKQFQMRFSVYIERSEEINSYNDELKFRFTPNFTFYEKYDKDLGILTQKIANSLVGELADAQTLYSHTLEVLADYLNPHNVGIVIDSSVEEKIKKVEERRALLDDYSKVCIALSKSDYYQEKPSFEEWCKWQEEFTGD